MSAVVSAARAIPKSATLTVPSSRRSRFCGFTSRCTRPAACACARPRQAWTASSTASSAAAARRRAVGERLAVDVLHHDERPPVVGLARVVDADDVRVREPRREPGLAQEALAEGRVAREVLGEQLDRHRAVRARRRGRGRRSPCRRGRAAARAGSGRPGRSSRSSLLVLLPWWCPWCGLCAFAAWARRSVASRVGERVRGRGERLLVASRDCGRSRRSRRCGSARPHRGPRSVPGVSAATGRPRPRAVAATSGRDARRRQAAAPPCARAAATRQQQRARGREQADPPAHRATPSRGSLPACGRRRTRPGGTTPCRPRGRAAARPRAGRRRGAGRPSRG